MLLGYVLALCLDAVAGLVAGEPEGWRARAVIDLLSSNAKAGGEGRWFITRLGELASKRANALGDQALILCDGGWCLPGEARVMPDIQDNDPIGAERWRELAGFAVVSTELSRRLDPTKELLKDLDGSPGSDASRMADNYRADGDACLQRRNRRHVGRFPDQPPCVSTSGSAGTEGRRSGSSPGCEVPSDTGRAPDCSVRHPRVVLPTGTRR